MSETAPPGRKLRVFAADGSGMIRRMPLRHHRRRGGAASLSPPAHWQRAEKIFCNEIRFTPSNP